MSIRRVASLLSTSAVVLMFPAPGFGQENMAAEQRPMYELPALVVAVSGETPLDQRAAALFEDGEWSEAADLYLDAAEGMPRNDANSYKAYDMAARLYFYGRSYSKSRAAMERAAEVAEATGDEVSAALRHVDAAFIAIWEGYPGSRREHVRRAQEHARSEGFGAENARKVDALIHGVESLPMDEDTD